MSWYINAIKNYAYFGGRARRKEYWMFILFNFIIALVFNIVDKMIGMPILSGVYGLLIFCPSLAISVRRLHDINKSGWWLLLALVPVIGWIAIFVFSVMEGTLGSNRYGEALSRTNL